MTRAEDSILQRAFLPLPHSPCEVDKVSLREWSQPQRIALPIVWTRGQSSLTNRIGIVSLMTNENVDRYDDKIALITFELTHVVSTEGIGALIVQDLWRELTQHNCCHTTLT